jgi:hypothetical protein
VSATSGVVGLLVLGTLGGLAKLGLRLANRRPNDIDAAAIIGDVLVIGDRRTELHGTYSVRRVVERRLGAYRVSDGVRIARVTERNQRIRINTNVLGFEGGVRMLGATDRVLWCSSAELPVHQRHPATLEIIDDGRHRLPALKPLDGCDDPVFDPATGRIHAYALDGRGLSIGVDLDTVEAPRPARTRVDSKIERVDELVLPGQTRVVLTGHDERRLRGVGEVAIFREGSLLVTRAHRSLPVLVAHRAPLVAGAAEQLTCVSEHARWTTTFERPILAKASHLFVRRDLIVLVAESPCEVVALDIASGAVRWRAKL